MRIALKRSPLANYHLAFLPKIAPWLLAFRAASQPARLVETAQAMRPLFARAVAEHEALSLESGAAKYLRRTGWLKLYRTEKAFAGVARELDLAAKLGIANIPLEREAARALEPSLKPVFRHAVHWTGAVSLSNPLAVTRAYAARFAALGGLSFIGDARTLHRVHPHWRVETASGPLDAGRGRHRARAVAAGCARPARHKTAARGQARLSPPFPRARQCRAGPAGARRRERLLLTPMEQGIRLTTGVEFAARDAPPTPVQFKRLLPAARELFPLGDPVEAEPFGGRTWLGARPCFADSRPVIGRAPGQAGLWLACGHAHWGLTLGPATGRLLAEMMTGATPFCDPQPYAAERFMQVCEAEPNAAGANASDRRLIR